MEKKQKEAERSRKNRLKRKNEFERYKENYQYALENHLPFVLSFEAKRLRHQPQEQPAQEQDQQKQQQPETNE
jgi:hypothetical protein